MSTPANSELRIQSSLRVGQGRAAALRARALATDPAICVERARIVTASYKETEAEPPVLRRAHALAAVLRGMTVLMEPDELLVGNQASRPRAAPVFPEYAINWLEEELDDLPTRSADPFLVAEEDKRELRELAAYWRGRTHEDRVLATLPEDVARAVLTVKAVSGVHLLASGPAHLAVDYPTVLAKGLLGIADEAKQHLAWLDEANPDELAKRPFLQAVVVALEAAVDFARRYAQLARQLAAAERDPTRREELLEIAAVCQRVPALPARTFHEALQAVLFLQIVLQIESNGHSVSLGRFDQYAFPFYAADVAAGRLSREMAVELVSCLWVKLFWVNKVRPWLHTQTAAGYPTYQNATIGGQTPDGADATNELTYICLEAMDDIRLPTPNFSARYHDGSPEEYLLRCAEVISHGFGAPAMEDDEIIVPSLLARGIAPRDAYDYSMVGCVEVAVPGKWGYHCNGLSFLNYLKVLELALNGGHDPASGLRLCPHERALGHFASFDDLLGAWRRQLAYYTRASVIFDSCIHRSYAQLTPDPFCSAVVRDCVARGLALGDGGALYDIVSGTQAGTANAANALAALRKLVFEEKAIDQQELAEALASNFAGPRGEVIRQMLLNRAPKYGNDDDYADLLGRRVIADYLEEIAQYRNPRWGRGPHGGNYTASTSTVSSHVPAGRIVGATPDGRLAGEPLAEGSSPYRGTDVMGPTAVIRSLSKLPSLQLTGGQLLNVKFSPAVLKDEAGRLRLVALLRAFADLKCWHIQFNVIAAETLRDAQAHPDQYRGLMVRVAGYCALFTTLDRAVQDDIIKRTEHAFVG